MKLAQVLEGRWETVACPPLSPGPPGSWRDLAMYTAQLIPEGSGYRLYFTSLTRDQQWALGPATAPDLRQWHRTCPARRRAHPALHAQPQRARPPGSSRPGATHSVAGSASVSASGTGSAHSARTSARAAWTSSARASASSSHTHTW